MNQQKIHSLLLRTGISFVFVVFGIWEIINPGYWTVFVPPFIHTNILTMVKLHGIILTVLGVGIISGLYRKLFAVGGTLIMLGIVAGLFLNGNYPDLLVRDITILLAVSSLLFLN